MPIFWKAVGMPGWAEARERQKIVPVAIRKNAFT
jgi:hypothetical protein